MQPKTKQQLVLEKNQVELVVDEDVSLEKVRDKSNQLLGLVDESFLTISLIYYVLQGFFSNADITAIARATQTQIKSFETLTKILSMFDATGLTHISTWRLTKEQVMYALEQHPKVIETIPSEIQRNYDTYVEFCEKVVQVIVNKREIWE